MAANKSDWVWGIAGLVSAVLLYVNWQFFNQPILGLVLFLVWWLASGLSAGHYLAKLLPYGRGYNNWLGLFFSLFVFGSIANVFTAWFKFTDGGLAVSLAATSAIILILNFFSRKKIPLAPLAISDAGGFWMPKKMFFFAGTLLIWGLILIYFSRSGAYLLSPWQALSPWFLPVVAALSLFIFALVFAKNKTGLVLAAIIIFSFLVHAYLLVYANGFGGDRWRHLGSEIRIMRGVEYQPTLLTQDLWLTKIAGVEVPRALIDGPKLSYGFEWSLSSAFAKISGLSIFLIDQYSLFILWSLFLPFLVFLSALAIKADKPFALLAAALTNVFAALQTYGSQTLPIGYGFLVFVFLILLLINYLRARDKKIIWLAALWLVSMYFNYSVALILGLMAAGAIFLPARKSPWRYAGYGFLASIIFWLEWPASRLVYILNAAKEPVSQITSLFFHSDRFVPFAMDQHLFLNYFLVLILLAVIVWQIGQARKEKNPGWNFIASMAALVLINFVLSWGLLFGLHTLSRRLNIFIDLFLILILAWALIGWYRKSRAGDKVKIAILSFGLSILFLLSYASGPILEAAITSDESKAMAYTWEQIQAAPNQSCVLANTWPLLALEAYSGKSVEAGNFPVGYNYSQDERVALFDAINLRPEASILNEAKKITGAEKCYLMINGQNKPADYLRAMQKLLGQPKVFGDNLLWRF